MPVLHTAPFGDIEYTPDAVFHFPSGLPGFEAEKDFVFIKQPNTEPLMFLQSLSHPAVGFIVLPILVADPQYRLCLDAEQLSELHLPAGRQPRIGTDVLCGTLVCGGDEENGGPTANLLAPIVVNLQERIGMQAIQNQSGYSHQHPLFRQEVFRPEDLAPCS